MVHRFTTVIRILGCFLAIVPVACHIGENAQGGDETPPPNTDPLQGCNLSCHGTEISPAPPNDTKGISATTERTVGAHASHLEAAPTWHRKILCQDCHMVPSEVASPGHIDQSPAELVFGAIAGAQASWNGTTCANVYCHGTTLAGGAVTEPQWTTVDGSQKQCSSCHGFPPPAPHPNASDCGTCHPTLQPGTQSFLDPESHIDGKVDLTSDVMACDGCHGGGGISAPPVDLAGNTDITARGVGAHRAHLGASTWHRELYCSQCHKVPTSVNDPGHMDGDMRAELTFDTLNPAGTYDQATLTCQTLYCHGNGRGNTGTVQWNVDLSLACNSCHSNNGVGMSGEHDEHIGEGIRCTECHSKVVDQNQNIIGAMLHIDGLHQVDMLPRGTWNPATRQCTNLACHGTERW